MPYTLKDLKKEKYSNQKSTSTSTRTKANSNYGYTLDDLKREKNQLQETNTLQKQEKSGAELLGEVFNTKPSPFERKKSDVDTTSTKYITGSGIASQRLGEELGKQNTQQIQTKPVNTNIRPGQDILKDVFQPKQHFGAAKPLTTYGEAQREMADYQKFVNTPEYKKLSPQDKVKVLDAKMKTYRYYGTPEWQAQDTQEYINTQEAKTPLGKALTRVSNQIGYTTGDPTNPLPEVSTGNGLLDTVSDTLGTGLGYFAPVGAPGAASNSIGSASNQLVKNIFAKAESKGLGKITKNNVVDKLIKSGVEGAVTTAPASAYSGAKEGLSPEELAKKVALESAGGALLGIGLSGASQGIGKGVNRLKNIWNKSFKNVNVTATTEPVVLEKVNTVQAKTLPGKLTLKNKGLETATNDYNNAIELIQNKYGTNELRANEIQLAKDYAKSQGYDLDEILTRMEKYETQSPKQVLDTAAEQAQIKRAAGVANENTYKTLDTIKQQIPKTVKPAPKDLPAIAKMTPDEFDTHYGLNRDLRGLSPEESTKIQQESINKMLDDIGQRIVNKTSTNDLKQIADYYTKKYNLPNEIKITKTLKSSNKPAQISFVKNPDKSIKSVTISVNPMKSTNQIVGAMRHEIEHYIDEVNGYKPINKNKVILNPNQPKTTRGMYNQYAKGHHQNYGWFEGEYLQKALKEDMDNGILKPSEIKAAQQEIAPVKELVVKPVPQRNVQAIKEVEKVKPVERVQPRGETVESGFNKNVKNDMESNDALRKSLDENPITHVVLKDEDVLMAANKRFNVGYDKALSEWRQNLNSFRPDDVPLARMLANEAAKRGDIATARMITADIADKLTQSGQFTRAAQLLRKSDPAVFVDYLERQLSKLNQEGSKLYGNKWKELKLSDKDLKEIYNLELIDETKAEKIMNDMYDKFAKEMPVTKMEKFDSWRRMAMLLNPKTHIRNVVGNGFMVMLRKTSDTMGAALEKMAGVKQGERTKSFLWSKDKGLVKIVDDDWNAVKNDIVNGGRWDIESVNMLNHEKPIFKKGLPTKALEKTTGKQFDKGLLEMVNEISKNTLNGEDVIFLKRAYKDALGQYMNANGIKEVTEAARNYAQRRAFEATFKESNIISNFISQAKKKKGLGKLVEAAIPFSKTPSNILIRSIEYSPAGLIKALYSKSTGKTAGVVIEDLSKGITGTGLTALGFLLANLGWARGEQAKSKNAETLNTGTGSQPFSIMTPIGSYTFDWSQPSSVPFAMGIAIHDAMQKENPSMIDTLNSAIASGGDTIFNMSMLKSIKDMMGGYSSPTESFMSLPVSYVEQAFPTVSGQAARSLDSTRRNTYDPNSTKQFINTFAAKTPFASKSLEPKLDMFGNEMKNGNAAEQFFSPGYFAAKSNDIVTNELKNLYDKTKDTSFLPKTVAGMKYKFTYNNETIQLTPKEATQLQKSMGQMNYQDINDIVNDPGYKDLTNEEKIKIIKKIVDANYDIAKDEIVQGRAK